nr:hypothetical protein [Tanacetum cinerariifolium]
MSHINLSQQQTGSSQQPSQEIQEEEDETEPVQTPTSKKPGSRGKRVKTIGLPTMCTNETIPNRHMQDDTVIGLPTRNPSSLETTSKPTMFQEMMQQQLEIERKEKMKRIDREVNSRVALNNYKRVAEDLKVLRISTDGMDPIDAAIVNAQNARIRALYHPNN